MYAYLMACMQVLPCNCCKADNALEEEYEGKAIYIDDEANDRREEECEVANYREGPAYMPLNTHTYI